MISVSVMLSLQDRADSYAKAFPKWPAPRIGGRWLDSVWVLGNDFRAKAGYYGEYPPNYLARIMALFPDARSVLHVFSGSLPRSKRYVTFDLQRVQQGRRKIVDPDVVGDAHSLHHFFETGPSGIVEIRAAGLLRHCSQCGERFEKRACGPTHAALHPYQTRAFDLVLADPPYTAEDATRYGTPMIRRDVVMREIRKVVERGANLVWLDTVTPMWRKKDWHLWGLIGIVRSSNHRVRFAHIFGAA